MILYQNSVLNMWNIWYAIHIFRHQNTLLMMPILNARQLSLLYVWLNFACSYRWDLKPQNSYYQISIVCKIIKIHFHPFFRCKILSIDFFFENWRQTWGLLQAEAFVKVTLDDAYVITYFLKYWDFLKICNRENFDIFTI